METVLIQIKDALIQLLKGLDPEIDVFCEEVKATDEEHGLEEQETYYFLEIVPNINGTVDKYFTDIGVFVDVAYHDRNESNTAYLIKAAELDGMIRPVFSFGDRHVTVPVMNNKVTDHVLHCSFTLSFRWARKMPAESREMGELEMAVRKGE
ncbi:MAG: translation initiation factor 2 [Lachnospiraceae bacterium]|nr:translation initiation factor 2 [Lachnospiraceae bacterium]MCM1240976.1 translation initiation factor 2 [Lachnospiraceae bacterium]